MKETKSKIISFAVLMALFLAAVAFAGYNDPNENIFSKRQVKRSTNYQSQNLREGKKNP